MQPVLCLSMSRRWWRGPWARLGVAADRAAQQVRHGSHMLRKHTAVGYMMVLVSFRCRPCQSQSHRPIISIAAIQLRLNITAVKLHLDVKVLCKPALLDVMCRKVCDMSQILRHRQHTLTRSEQLDADIVLLPQDGARSAQVGPDCQSNHLTGTVPPDVMWCTVLFEMTSPQGKLSRSWCS